MAGSLLIFGKGHRQRGVPLTGGGGNAQLWTPTFAGAGASLEVHYLDAQGQWLKNKTYVLSATMVGAYGLGVYPGDSGNWNADKPEGCEAVIAFCRLASITIGRGGLDGGNANNCDPASPQPETLQPGDALQWGLVAGSHGWKIIRNDSGSAGATPVQVSLSTATNIGGTVTLGGTAQVVSAANPARLGGYIYNPYNATESLFVSESGTATTGSPELKAGGMWSIQSTNAISVLGATTGHVFDGEVR